MTPTSIARAACSLVGGTWCSPVSKPVQLRLCLGIPRPIALSVNPASHSTRGLTTPYGLVLVEQQDCRLVCDVTAGCGDYHLTHRLRLPELLRTRLAVPLQASGVLSRMSLQRRIALAQASQARPRRCRRLLSTIVQRLARRTIRSLGSSLPRARVGWKGVPRKGSNPFRLCLT